MKTSFIIYSATLVLLAGITARAQTNVAAQADKVRAFIEATEKVRTQCVEGRRTICGRIEKVLPEGLIIDSGYTNLLRMPLERSWLLPGTVEARREPNLVEGKEADDVCVGLVYLTDVPKPRLLKPRAYDFVVIHAYPAGLHTYTSVGTVQHTVRRFSVNLQTAVDVNREAAGIKPPVFAASRK